MEKLLFCIYAFLMFCSTSVSGQSIENFNGNGVATVPLPEWSSSAATTTATKTFSNPITGSFTDSQGRTILYRFSIPLGMSVTSENALLLSFHGNNSGSQQDMLDFFFTGVEYEALGRNLIPVVLASPEAYDNGVRFWSYEDDQQTVYELIRDGLTNHFNIDTDRIYFSGGSQGTCFLNEFVQSFGTNYGGGFYGGCGCYPSLDVTWSPPQSFKNNFKVYIGSTQDDFLFDVSRGGYGYYKYAIGLNTRGDLTSQGDHCSLYWSQQTKALDWFTGVNNISSPTEPYWQRVNAIDNLIGIAADDDSAIWAIQQSTLDSFRLLKSINGGASFFPVGGNVDGLAEDFIYTKGRLIVRGSNNEIWRSTNKGVSFQLLENNSAFSGSGFINNNLVSDESGAIFRSGYPQNQRSQNLGDSWSIMQSSLGVTDQGIVNLDSKFYGQNAPLIISEHPTTQDFNSGSFNINKKYLSFSNSNSWTAIQDTGLGQVEHAAWDGSSLWGISTFIEDVSYWGRARVFKSTNLGSTWQPIQTPFDNKQVTGARLTALGKDIILVHGGGGGDIYNDVSSWLTLDGGNQWFLVHGLAHAAITYPYFGEPAYNKALQDIYYTNGSGVFKLILPEGISLEIDVPNPPLISPILHLLFSEN